MRLAGTIPNEADAKRFVDFLYTRNIPAMAEPASKGAWDIWINEESHLAESKLALEAFLANPTSDQYKAAPEQAKRMAREVRRRRQQAAGNFIPMQHHWKSPGVKGRRPLTLALIAICTGIGLMTSFGSDRGGLASYLYMTSARGPSQELIDEANRQITENPNLTPADLAELLRPQTRSLPEIRRGEIWRLVTPILLHQSFFHLLFNMYWLFLLGGMVEDRYGSLWLGGFVILTVSSQPLAAAWVRDWAREGSW